MGDLAEALFAATVAICLTILVCKGCSYDHEERMENIKQDKPNSVRLK